MKLFCSILSFKNCLHRYQSPKVNLTILNYYREKLSWLTISFACGPPSISSVLMQTSPQSPAAHHGRQRGAKLTYYS